MTTTETTHSARVKRWQAHLALAVLALACVDARPAHAGMFGWIDDMFTFREDQKQRVAPRRTLPPKEVVVPYYDQREHERWSGYYTRNDLTPQNYLDGSASKVMRPPVEPVRQNLAYGTIDGGPAATPGYRDSYQYQPRANRETDMPGNGGDTMIGAPRQAQSFGSDDGSGDVGQATKIGAPTNDWRGEPGLADSRRNAFSPRPGDFDYRAPVGGNLALDDSRIEGRSAEDVVGNPRRSYDDRELQSGLRDEAGVGDAQTDPRKDPRYVGFNKKGQVTKYQVQRGDTLSSIAGQDAIYDNWKLWPLIYSANRRAIGHDPDNLTYQQKLGIPRGYTRQQAKEAEQRAGRRAP